MGIIKAQHYFNSVSLLKDTHKVTLISLLISSESLGVTYGNRI